MLGVIGGLGPVATTRIVERIQEQTPADCDQDHIPMLVDVYAPYPERIDAIDGDDAALRQALVERATTLDDAGAERLVIGSHTTHLWYDVVDMAVSVPVYHMPQRVGTVIDDRGYAEIAVLCTSGVAKVDLYGGVTEASVEYVVCEDAMYAFKAGEKSKAASLFRQQVPDKPSVVACTDLSCLDADVTMDALTVMADDIVSELGET